MLKIKTIGSIVVILLATMLPLTSGLASAANNYGRDAYGSCTYGPCTSTNTVTETPSGLQVAVNLTNGQIIPADGYTIVITPLNGQGSSFEKVDVYVGDTLATTLTPGADGSASWFWDPSLFPGEAIKIIVTDQNGQTVTQNFAVSVRKATEQPATPNPNSNATTNRNQDSKVLFGSFGLSGLGTSVTKVIRTLPEPVVYSFPYFLFVLLLVEITVLLLQVKRELKEVHIIESLIARQKNVRDMKEKFIQLISHYLRTPLTIVRGGAEMLTAELGNTAAATAVTGYVENMHSVIEQSIADADILAFQAPVVGGEEYSDKTALKAKVLVWLPVGFIGVVAFGFVYLTNRVTEYDTSMVNLITQMVIYSILVLTLYQMVQRLRLRRRDKKVAEHILSQENLIQTERDNVIVKTADSLKFSIDALQKELLTLPAESKAAAFVRRGMLQLKTVNDKFVIATHLKGGYSTQPYVPTSLAALLGNVHGGIQERATQHGIGIHVANDMSFSVQSVPLMTLVLQNVLDNAVAFSPDNGSIEIDAQGEGGTTISVVDHGAGVSSDKLSQLFQPFTKVDGIEKFDREGMGFSLYLDKIIMTYMGGDISLETEPGQYTKVKLQLPQNV